MKMFRYGSLVMGLALIMLSGCAALEDALLQKKPSAILMGVHLTDISLKSASLVNLDYDVSSKAQQLFTGAADLQTTIPAESSQKVALPVTLNYIDLEGKTFHFSKNGRKTTSTCRTCLSLLSGKIINQQLLNGGILKFFTF